MKSKYQIGWIGIRCERVGRAASMLKKEGWIRIGHAELNNRNAWNWIRPVQTAADFTAQDWSRIARAGLVGIGIWFTDAQWGLNSAITDVQWQSRKMIE